MNDEFKPEFWKFLDNPLGVVWVLSCGVVWDPVKQDVVFENDPPSPEAWKEIEGFKSKPFATDSSGVWYPDTKQLVFVQGNTPPAKVLIPGYDESLSIAVAEKDPFVDMFNVNEVNKDTKESSHESGVGEVWDPEKYAVFKELLYDGKKRTQAAATHQPKNRGKSKDTADQLEGVGTAKE